MPTMEMASATEIDAKRELDAGAPIQPAKRMIAFHPGPDESDDQLELLPAANERGISRKRNQELEAA